MGLTLDRGLPASEWGGCGIHSFTPLSDNSHMSVMGLVVKLRLKIFFFTVLFPIPGIVVCIQDIINKHLMKT